MYFSLRCWSAQNNIMSGSQDNIHRVYIHTYVRTLQEGIGHNQMPSAN